MKLWVGGATGFLGAELARQLAAHGHDLVLVSRGGGEVDTRRVASLDVSRRNDVAESAAGCEGAFFAVGKVSRSARDREALHQANVVAARAGLLGLRDAGVRRVVFVSSSGTIACGTDPTRLGTEICPPPLQHITRWPYFHGKWLAEQEALALNDPGRFEVVVINPSLLLGPGDRRGSSTLDVRRFLTGAIPALSRGGFGFVDVRDAASAAIKAFERGRAGERYLLSGANVSVPEFFARLGRLSGRPVPVLRLPANPRLAVVAHRAFQKVLGWVGRTTPIEVESVDVGSHFWFCDSAKARRELGFAPRDPTATLRDTLLDLAGEAGPPRTDRG